MGKKSSVTAIPRISSASDPAAPSKTNSSNQTSILRSAFAPSSFQLHLFASVIQSFESQQLRIHDIDTGRLCQQHAARPGTTITSLDWGHYSPSHRENGTSANNKKRKRRLNTAEEVVIAYGTSSSEICMYSPAEGRVVGKLSGAHEKGVKDFRFSEASNTEGWSIGGDSKLVQWDLSGKQAIRSIPLPDPATSVLSPPSSRQPFILCASTTPFALYPSEDFRIDPFDSFKGLVHSLRRSAKIQEQSTELFLAADSDRYINVFDTEQKKIVRTLIVGSEVEQIDLSSPTAMEEQLLVVVTKDGIVELFANPFKLPTFVNGDLKSKRKSMTRKANAQMRLINDSKKQSSVFAASVQGPDLIVVSVDAGVDPAFQKVRWQDEGSGELLFEGTKDVLKIRSTSTLNAAQMNGAKDMGKTYVDESKTVVVNGTGDPALQDAAIEISSGEEDDEDESEDESETEAVVANGDEDSDHSDAEVEQSEALAVIDKSADPEDAEMLDAEDQEPSFGDLLASKHPTTIAIADSFEPEKSTFDANKQLALPSGMSLGTVLTQALKTNDRNLLESCLHANDAGIIQNTIQRLDSTLATNLLAKLAERLASRPGRYGHLLSWVQWTCIAHGGAIAGQPDVAAKIRTLYGVLSQRSKSLDKLLLLKGKLDMLDAQLKLRKQIQAQRGAQIQDQGEPGMIYIEGEEDNWSSDEDIDEAVGVNRRMKSKKASRRTLEDLVGDEATSEDDDDDDDKMPVMNGVVAEGSDEEEESDEEAEVSGRTRGGMYDIEADVSGEEEGSEEEDDDEGEVDNSDDDEDDDEDSSMESFINDGEISLASEEDDIDLDDEPEIRKPEKKKSKHK